MYSPLITNEKQGMAVEEVRLQEIRQQIKAQHLSDTVKAAGSDQRAGLLVGWLGRAKVLLTLSDQKHGFNYSVSRLLWTGVWGKLRGKHEQ